MTKQPVAMVFIKVYAFYNSMLSMIVYYNCFQILYILLLAINPPTGKQHRDCHIHMHLVYWKTTRRHMLHLQGIINTKF